MNPVSELFTGPTGNAYSSFSALVLLGLMFFISLRLYLQRNKKAYSTFILSIVFASLPHLFSFFMSAREEALPESIRYVAVLLKLLAFILLHTGIYQLYNRSTRRVYALVSFTIVLTLTIEAAYWIRYDAATEEQALLLQLLPTDLWLTVMVLGTFVIVAPRVGQPFKYRLALGVFLLGHLAHLTDYYLVDEKAAFLETAQNILPIVYYCILLLFLLERVVELLQAIYQSSIRDGLTGVYNRTYFISKVRAWMKQHAQVSIVFTDIDNFKKLNDTQGHQKGDEALKQVAAIIMEMAEEAGGIAGRYGGEELVALLPDPKVKPGEFAERLRSRIETETIVTVSVGYSTFNRSMTVQQLLKQADEAMYVSKTTGKNKVSAYTDGNLG